MTSITTTSIRASAMASSAAASALRRWKPGWKQALYWKPKQHLRSQHEHAGLVQRVLDFILEAARVLGFGRALAGARAFGSDGCHISETLRIVRRCRWRAASFAQHRDQC